MTLQTITVPAQNYSVTNLSFNETAILRLLALDYGKTKIMYFLEISTKEYETILDTVFQKLNVTDLFQALVVGVKQGHISRQDLLKDLVVEASSKQASIIMGNSELLKTLKSDIHAYTEWIQSSILSFHKVVFKAFDSQYMSEKDTMGLDPNEIDYLYQRLRNLKDVLENGVLDKFEATNLIYEASISEKLSTRYMFSAVRRAIELKMLDINKLIPGSEAYYDTLLKQTTTSIKKVLRKKRMDSKLRKLYINQFLIDYYNAIEDKFFYL